MTPAAALARCEAWMARWRDMPPVHNLEVHAFLEFSDQLDRTFADFQSMPASMLGTGPESEAVYVALYEVGARIRSLGDHPLALRWFEELQAKARDAGADSARARAMVALGNTLSMMGQNDEALPWFREAAALWSRIGGENSLVRIPHVLLNEANCLSYLRRHEEAESLYRRILSMVKEVPADTYAGHTPGLPRPVFLAMVMNNMAYNLTAQGAITKPETSAYQLHKRADARYREALALRPGPTREMGYQINIAWNLISMGSLDEGDQLLGDLDGLARSIPDLKAFQPEIHFRQAQLAIARGQWDRARELSHTALHMSLRQGDILHERKVTDGFLVLVQQMVAHLRDAAGADPVGFLLRDTGASIVEDLATFLEQKDTYTGLNHSKAVANIASRLGKILLETGAAEAAGPLEPAGGWDHRVNHDVLRLGGILHDIGKLSIPWSLLNRATPLTPAERTVLRSHAQEGERILNQIGLAEIGRITVEHHETPLGDGYPYGVTDSSLMGACVAVADAFEAATTVKRSWRKPKTRDEAVREIVSLGGVQFDPRVAKAFPRLFSS